MLILPLVLELHAVSHFPLPSTLPLWLLPNRMQDEIRNYGERLDQEHADAEEFNEIEASDYNHRPDEPNAIAASSRWDSFRAESDSAAPEDDGCDAAETEAAGAEYVLQLATSHKEHGKRTGGFKRDHSKRSYTDHAQVSSAASASVNNDPVPERRSSSSAASFSRGESAHNRFEQKKSGEVHTAPFARDRISADDVGASAHRALAANSRAALIPSSTAPISLAALPPMAASPALVVPSNVRANSKWAAFAAPEIDQESADENISESHNQDAKRMRISNASFAHALPSFGILKSNEAAAQPASATSSTFHVPHFAAHSLRPSLSTILVSDDELALLDF